MDKSEEGDLFRMRADGHGFRGPIDEFMEIERDRVHLQASGLQLRQVQNVVEQVQQA